jgi:hypothetical protein
VSETIADFNNLAAAQVGIPYVFGGTSLRGSAHPGVDCSGLPYAVSLALGESIPRTSEAQYAGLPAVAEVDLRRGDLVLLDVPGDTQPQPAHVVIWWNASTVLQAPHTGEDVMFSPTLPYTIMGYRRLPFPDAAPVPPIPTPTEDDMAFQMCDPASGKTLATDANGNFYGDSGIAPTLIVTTLAQHPDWQAGEAESAGKNPCVGLVPWKDPTGAWGYAYVTKPAGGSGSLGPYSTYHIRRDGTPS